MNIIDVQLAINQTLGVTACTGADLNRDGQCNVLDVQVEINSVLSGTCIATVPSVPVISSFVATPAAINAGQSSTLSWSVTGATALSINQNVGVVTGQTSRVVSPAATTTYTLTATNSAGSATAQVLLAVNPPTSGATITLLPSTTFQTMKGWEAVAEACQIDCSGWNSFKDALYDAAAEMGINRLRLEIHTTATCTAPTWDYTRLDDNIIKVVNPMRSRLAAQGERLWVNLEFVDDIAQCYGNNSASSRPRSEYINRFRLAVQHIQSAFGWTPDSFDVVLEPSWISRFWTPTDFLNVVPLLEAELINNAGIADPYLIGPSTAGGSVSFNTFFDEMGSTARNKLSELAYHRYDTVTPSHITSRSATAGIPPAMLEGFDADHNDLHIDLKDVGVVAWEKYSMAYYNVPGSPVYDNSMYFRIAGSDGSATTFQITNQSKFLRQYFKYIRRDAVRIGATTANPTFDPIAFRNTNGKHVVVIKASGGGTFSIGGLPGGSYGIKYTTSTQYNIDNPDATITAGANLSTSIPAAGVLTVYGK